MQSHLYIIIHGYLDEDRNWTEQLFLNDVYVNSATAYGVRDRFVNQNFGYYNNMNLTVKTLRVIND